MESMNESSSDQHLPTEPVEGATWSRYVTSLGAILLVTWPLLSYGIIDTERARWQHAAARVAWDQGDREKALEALHRAVELDPGNLAALADRARCQGELGEYEKSRQDLESAADRVGNLEQEIQLRITAGEAPSQQE